MTKPHEQRNEEVSTDDEGLRSSAASTISVTYRGHRSRIAHGSVSGYDVYDVEPPAEPVIQVGGHGMLQRDEGDPDWLVKEVPQCEMAAYASVQGTELEDVFAGYGGREQCGPLHRIKLRDLTAGMKSPCVMDIKMGKRTFLESEVTNAKLRPDLAAKMAKLDKGAVTEAELRDGVTKLRYMQFREVRSSSAEFGFRIEGATAVGGVPYPGCKELRTAEQLTDALRYFVQSRVSLRSAFVERLKHMRELLDNSDWFRGHEVVGSSILFAYDEVNGDAGDATSSATAKMIDFAKTEPLLDGQMLSHRAKWEVGNREDGYLTGLDNLIEIWSKVEATRE